MSFEEQLATLVSRAVADAQHDAETLGQIVERLAASLGFTVAIAVRGDGAAIDRMMEAASVYALEEAARRAPLARAIAARGR